ncbi:MAG: GNAT family N-acetyltransferase [Burkholderiales bacterium]|nr:GNAT family N-acetyltransferase [Burkholderiales bacterium]
MKARNVTLRLANGGDARAIAALSRDLIEHGLGWSWTPERVARNLANPDTSAVVACEGARLIGFAIMYFGDEAAHLNLLAVRAEYQRAGVGRRLFEWLRESALVAGIAVVRLELRASNRAGRRFYASLGFEETGFVPFYYRGRETALRMALRLRAATA